MKFAKQMQIPTLFVLVTSTVTSTLSSSPNHHDVLFEVNELISKTYDAFCPTPKEGITTRTNSKGVLETVNITKINEEDYIKVTSTPGSNPTTETITIPIKPVVVFENNTVPISNISFQEPTGHQTGGDITFVIVGKGVEKNLVYSRFEKQHIITKTLTISRNCMSTMNRTVFIKLHDVIAPKLEEEEQSDLSLLSCKDCVTQGHGWQLEKCYSKTNNNGCPVMDASCFKVKDENEQHGLTLEQALEYCEKGPSKESNWFGDDDDNVIIDNVDDNNVITTLEPNTTSSSSMQQAKPKEITIGYDDPDLKSLSCEQCVEKGYGWQLNGCNSNAINNGCPMMDIGCIKAEYFDTLEKAQESCKEEQVIRNGNVTNPNPNPNPTYNNTQDKLADADIPPSFPEHIEHEQDGEIARIKIAVENDKTQHVKKNKTDNNNNNNTNNNTQNLQTNYACGLSSSVSFVCLSVITVLSNIL